MNTTGLPERITKWLAESDECWVWTGSKTSNGYGMTSANGRGVLVHRHVYELLVGPIGDGLVIDHLCRVRACVNPAHLEAVTELENLRRAGTTFDGRTHCLKGLHELTPDNVRTKVNGRRHCRQCDRIANRIWRKKRQKLLAGASRE